MQVGSVHGLALMPDGSVLSWGDGKFGQTGVSIRTFVLVSASVFVLLY